MADLEPTTQRIVIDKRNLPMGVGVPLLTLPGPGDDSWPSQFHAWLLVAIVIKDPIFDISVKLRALVDYGEMWGIPLEVLEGKS